MKRYDDKIIGTLLLTAIGISIIAFVTSSFVKFPPKLSPEEQKLTAFSATSPVLTVRAPVAIGAINCPVMLNHDVVAGTTIGNPALQSFPPGAPPAPESQLPAMALESVSSGPVVSFIMLDSGKRLAIINGRIVKEGERFQNGSVLRIETNRVLFKEGKGEQWLHLK